MPEAARARLRWNRGWAATGGVFRRHETSFYLLFPVEAGADSLHNARMATRLLPVALIAVVLASGCGDRVANVAGGTGPTQHSITVAQGKHVVVAELLLDQGMAWSNLSGSRTGYVSPKGTYYAPLTLPSEPTVLLEGAIGPLTETVVVHLEPGPVAPSDCQAPGQPDPREDAHASPPVEELPKPIVRVPPIYPDSARQAGVSGMVVLKALVCACGEVSDIVVVNSVPMLDQASIDAIRQWFFIPATNGGEPVATWVTIPVRFSLH